VTTRSFILDNRANPTSTSISATRWPMPIRLMESLRTTGGPPACRRSIVPAIGCRRYSTARATSFGRHRLDLLQALAGHRLPLQLTGRLSNQVQRRGRRLPDAAERPALHLRLQHAQSGPVTDGRGAVHVRSAARQLRDDDASPGPLPRQSHRSHSTSSRGSKHPIAGTASGSTVPTIAATLLMPATAETLRAWADGAICGAHLRTRM
jgi:hypothetical protein